MNLSQIAEHVKEKLKQLKSNLQKLPGRGRQPLKVTFGPGTKLKKVEKLPTETFESYGKAEKVTFADAGKLRKVEKVTFTWIKKLKKARKVTFES